MNKSGPKTTKLDFVTGSTFTQKNWEGEVLETTAEWDGEVLVVVTADNKKKKGSVTVRRYLQGEHLVMVNKQLQLPTIGHNHTLTCGADCLCCTGDDHQGCGVQAVLEAQGGQEEEEEGGEGGTAAKGQEISALCV